MKLINLLTILFFQTVYTQDKVDSILSIREKYEYEHFQNQTFSLSKKLELSDNSSKEYKSQGEYYSTYIIFYNNQEYTYYSIFEGGFNVCFGNWSKLNENQYSLTWDKEKTISNYKKKNLIEKMFKYAYPTPIKMDNWIFNIISKE